MSSRQTESRLGLIREKAGSDEINSHRSTTFLWSPYCVCMCVYLCVCVGMCVVVGPSETPSGKSSLPYQSPVGDEGVQDRYRGPCWGTLWRDQTTPLFLHCSFLFSPSVSSSSLLLSHSFPPLLLLLLSPPPGSGLYLRSHAVEGVRGL